MQNITYLLGAGASAGALPIYSNFKNRFSLFCKLISSKRQVDFKELWQRDSLELLQKNSKSLLDELAFHSTPDIVAKKYFIQNNLELLNNLKATLIAYFFYEQTLKRHPGIIDRRKVNISKQIVDNRYDSFVSRLLAPIRGKFRLSQGINILTWNYDYQFEITCKFFSNKLIDDLNEIFITHPNPFGLIDLSLNPDSFKVIHLNGVALSTNANPVNGRIADLLGQAFTYEDYPADYLIELNHYLLKDTGKLCVLPENHLFFGWEKLDEYLRPNENWSLFKDVKDLCKSTEVLVIIGYSFPSFNNEIDSYLFENFDNLHTIYIQDTNFENIKSVIESDFKYKLASKGKYDLSIFDVGYTNQFFIPRQKVEGKELGKYNLTSL